MVEEWLTFRINKEELLQCDRCSGWLRNQEVYVYVNVDRELEEVLCENCWKIVQEEEK